MRTPVEVTDELFARMRSFFDDGQLVEITALLTLVNIDRIGHRAVRVSAEAACENLHKAFPRKRRRRG